MDDFRRKIGDLINDSRDAQEVDKILAEVEQRVKVLEAAITAWEELYRADQELSKSPLGRRVKELEEVQAAAYELYGASSLEEGDYLWTQEYEDARRRLKAALERGKQDE